MPMLQHTVFFWLKPDLTAERRAAFMAGVKGLADSPNVASCRVGTTANTPRDVVDNSYDVQLVCGFNSQAEHDAYQSADDAVHQIFIDGNKDCWTKVLVYDSLEA